MALKPLNAKTNLYYWKQSSFAGGEYSPDMYGRDDLNQYAIGAKQLKNFIPGPYGSFYNRPGFQFINSCKYANKKCRLVSFIYNEEYAYVLEFGDYYIRFYKDSGIIEDSSSNIIEVTTPYSADDLYDLHFTQSADTLYICHRNYPTKTLVRNSDISWTLSDFDFQRGPFRTENETDITLTPSATAGTITVTASSGVFTSGMVGGLLRISHEVFGQVYAVHNVSSDFTGTSLQCNGNWSFQITDPWAAAFSIQISNDNGGTWNTLKVYGTTDSSSAVSDSGNIDHYCLLRVVVSGSSGGNGSLSLSCDSFINDGVVKITGYTSPTVVTGIVFTDDNDYVYGLSNINATKTWAIGAWNNEYGYPSCSTFYQDRLIFASTNKDRLDFWASETGNYNKFYVHTDVQDDDAINKTLVSGRANDIQNMLSLNSILAFTYGSEWKVNSGSSKSAITPSSLNAAQQSSIGASKLMPLILNDRALFVTRLGNSVRDFSYDVYSDTFKGDEQTLYSRHLFKNYSLIDWTYQSVPDDIVWVVRSDGTLLSFTYIYDEKVKAWAQHNTDGYFESICSIPGDLQDEVFVVVRRIINGETVRYIEKLHTRLASEDIKDQFFVDSGLTLKNAISISGITNTEPAVITSASHGLASGDYIDIFDINGMTELNNKRFIVGTVTTDTLTLKDLNGNAINSTDYGIYSDSGAMYKCVTTISGLDHLEGKDVAILANGSYLGTKTVSSGSVALGARASIVQAGLPYIADFESLDIQIPRQDGASRSRKKKLVEPIVTISNSYGGKIGLNDFNSMQKLPTALGDYLGSPASLITAQLKTFPLSSVLNEATVTVEQDLPLPLTVNCIVAGVNMP